MAGAGPVTEKLPVVSVPSWMSDGGRFLRWDDQEASCAVYMVYVDEKGHVLYWKPEDYSKDPEVLCLTAIRDVRTGSSARVPRGQDNNKRDAIKAFCSQEQESSSIQERTITVIYGPNMVDLTYINFVSSSIAEAKEWTNALFLCTNNLLKTNAPPLKFLECFYTTILVQQNQEGDIPAKLLVKQLVTSRDDKKRANDTLQSVGLAGGGKKDTIKASDFTFETFLEFYNHLVRRDDIDKLFAELGAKKKPYLTNEQLVKFLNNRQRDPRLNEILFPYYNMERAQGFIDAYEANKDFADRGYISIAGLTNFLMSTDNQILLPSKLQIHQDLTFPVTHYFINSSHNTYLTGHQLTGKSSVEIYHQVLLAGCRCIELDCWDGNTAEHEPVITHGKTLCTEILFKDVIEAIKESAFKTTDYPLILSFENHCSSNQQLKMAMYCVQIFGDLLMDKSLDEFPLEVDAPLPSPTVLKRKILIKNKKRIIKDIKRSPSGVEYSFSDSFSSSLPIESALPEEGVPVDAEGDTEGDDKDAEAEAEAIIIKTEDDEQLPEEEAQQELSDLVNYFQPVHFKGFERAEKVRKCYEMSSFTENNALNYLKEQPVEFVNYNKFQPSRIYPKGSRITSDNYMPQLFWNAGCQFVALNYQTLDVPMMLNLGKFEMNGRCGFLLKPEHMRRTDRTFDPFVESPVDGIIAGDVHVRVLSAQCLSERRVSTYVEVEMYGLPGDTIRRKYRTKVVQNNGLNPIYEEEAFKFKVILPHLAELRLAVYEDNGRMIGHRILPVDGLSPGYRHIKLRNDCYQPMLLPTLFVDIVTKDNVPDGFSAFADALSNPMKYLSEKEKEDKRANQMAALMEDDEEEEEEKKDTVVSTVPDGGPKKSPPCKSEGKRSEKETEINKKPNNKKPSSAAAKPVPVAKPQSTSHEILDVKLPDMELLMDHKVYLKFKQKHDSEMQVVIQKHAKDRTMINKAIEADAKQMRSSVEREKVIVKKRNSKMLKKAEKENSRDGSVKDVQSPVGKEGSFNDVYNDCASEINDLNVKHEQEMDQLMRNQQVKVKEQFKVYYQEQLDLAKSQVEPKVSELRKILTLVEEKERKNLEDYHERKIGEVKKEQDKQIRESVKNLTKNIKDKAELQKEKRIQNKKHIEQSVKLRQEMKSSHSKEVEVLSKRYDDLKVALNGKAEKDLQELQTVFDEKFGALETEDLQKLIPILLPPKAKEGLETRKSGS